MHLSELRLRNLRIIEDLELSLGPGWNAFIGANGAGKTSILEAAYVLSHGHTFRRGAKETLTRHQSDGFALFARLQGLSGRETRLGLGRFGGRLEARIDGENASLGDLVRRCAVVCFEPGSHEWIAGAAEERRRFLDWGVFHVEPDFLSHWRRYQRALRQRNTLLRDGGADDWLEPWEIELAESGEAIARMRSAYVERLWPHLQACLDGFLGDLGPARMELSQGWPVEQALATSLAEGRASDRERGHTRRGPHRAEWTIRFERAPRREHLSRGQEKLCALALVLAQAELFAEVAGEWPILCLDDLGSELDQAHQAEVISRVDRSGAQVLISGTELVPALAQPRHGLRLFHVEQGRLRA